MLVDVIIIFRELRKTRSRVDTINRIGVNEANETHYSTIDDSVLPSLFRVGVMSVFNKKKKIR